MALDVLHQSEPIHTRHLCVSQNKREWLSGFHRPLHRRQSGFAALRRCRVAAPPAQPFRENQPVRSIIVDDEHAEVLQAGWRRQGQLCLGAFRQTESRGEVELATFALFEYEPGARLLWSPSNRQAAWAAISRAIRQPTLEDIALRFNETAMPGPDGVPTLVSVFGNPHFQSEELLAYEVGYRAQASRRVSADFSAFYNIYDRLRTYEPVEPFLESSPPPLHLVIPQVTMNKMHGSTYGAEVSSTLSVSRWWKVSPGYAWLKMNLHADPGSLDTNSPLAVGNSPRHQFQIRSSIDLPQHFEFDSGLYYVGRLSALGVSDHARVDARLGWRPARSWELSVVGQNLLQPRHIEFADETLIISTQIQRSVFGEIRWWFGGRSP